MTPLSGAIYVETQAHIQRSSLSHTAACECRGLFFASWEVDYGVCGVLKTGLVSWPQVRADPQLLRGGGVSLERWWIISLQQITFLTNWNLTKLWQPDNMNCAWPVLTNQRARYSHPWPIRGQGTLSPSNCLLSIQFPWLVILTHCVYWWQSK